MTKNNWANTVSLQKVMWHTSAVQTQRREVAWRVKKHKVTEEQREGGKERENKTGWEREIISTGMGKNGEG